MTKKKITILVLLIVAIGLGFGLVWYINKPVENERYGLTVTTSDVSSTGLSLHLARASEGVRLVDISTRYEVRELTLLGWQRVAANEWYTQMEMADGTIVTKLERGEVVTLELNLKKACGRLPSGVYNISTKVESETIDVPFFVVNWWQILKVVIVALIIVLGIWAECRYSLWEKTKSYILNKKKQSLIILSALLLVGIASFVIYLYVPIKDFQLGISMQVKESSSTGVELEIVRDDSGSGWDVSTMIGIFSLERWTLSGWKQVDIPNTSGGYGGERISEEYAQIETIDWERHCGKQPSGLYRIIKEVKVSDADESWEQEYDAPFIIMEPWETVLLVVGILLLPIMICMQRRFRTVSRIWNWIIRHKKRSIAIFIIVLLVICLAEGMSLLYYLYHYERHIMQELVMSERIDDGQKATMEVYSYSHFGSVDEETPYLDEDEEPIKLSDDQRDVIQSRFTGKTLQPYRRLWYRFDAVIMFGDELKYMLDLKNGIIFVEEPSLLSELSYGDSGDGMRIRYCIMLPEYELQTLKDYLKGTGLKHID